MKQQKQAKEHAGRATPLSTHRHRIQLVRELIHTDNCRTQFFVSIRAKLILLPIENKYYYYHDA